LVKHPPHNKNSKIIKNDLLEFNNPDPHAINRNKIGVQPLPPPNIPDIESQQQSS
jgi:hypothetical protein